ncbi:MAG: hypothetical protein DRI26_00115 [Chloroflexi bacterium]|nr:MAG: hypothetical protein DRI26_00115 [Chloroflexota bacterium]
MMNFYSFVMVRKIFRPWGVKVQYLNIRLLQLALLVLRPYGRTSLQYHKHRFEILIRVRGRGKRLIVAPPFCIHRCSGPAVYFEVALGWFDENDIVRLQDDYGRVSKK